MVASVALAIASLLTDPSPQAAACDPGALFARVQAASGGPAWNNVAETVATGTVLDSGLTGTTTVAIDVRDGRSAIHDDLDLEKLTLVFDGTTVWQMDSSLGVHRLDAPDARAAAISDAYLARHGYSGDGSGATFECLGQRTETTGAFDLVRVTPVGGRPIEVWIDRASGLVDRTAQQAPTDVITTTYRGYRQVDGVMLPFETSHGDGTPGGTTVRRFSQYRVLQQAQAADFARPPEPANQRIANGVQAVVPFTVEDGETLVEATIDGRGPFPFILDTGGHAILTRDAALALGLKMRGEGQSGGGGEGKIGLQFTRVSRLAIGAAQIDDLPFLVIPYDRDFSDRGAGKPPLAGILGLEIFERFAVRLDYGKARMTLTPLASFAHAGRGAALRMSFQEDVPLVQAAADGAPGLFEVDTGNSGPTVLIGDYLKRNGFFERYDAGIASTGSGTGGIVRSATHRMRRLTFDGYDLDNFIANFVVQQKGTFSSRTEAGNVGYDVLSQFTPTFDYGSETLYLERRPNAPLPVYNRVGLGLGPASNGALQIASVFPASPASDAGLKVGQRVISVNGIPAAQLAGRFRTLARKPVGSTMTIVVERDGAHSDPNSGARVTVKLRLRELMCNGTSPCTPRVVPHESGGS